MRRVLTNFVSVCVAGGKSLGEAFAHVALSQWGYMTDPESIHIDPSCDRVIEASGRDPITLLYTFLDRCLYEFTGDDFLAAQLQVLDFVAPGVPLSLPADLQGPDDDDSHRPDPCYIRVAARGERFVFGRHPQGTEVKAVTFSNMQIVLQVSDDVETASQGNPKGYSGVSLAVRDRARLLQYTANEVEEEGLGLTAEGEGEGAGAAAAATAGAGGQDVAVASATEAAVTGAGAGVPGLSSATAAVVQAGAGATGLVGGDEESVCTPAGGAMDLPTGAEAGGSAVAGSAVATDGHAVTDALGVRRGPVDVYVIVDI